MTICCIKSTTIATVKTAVINRYMEKIGVKAVGIQFTNNVQSTFSLLFISASKFSHDVYV